MSRLRTALLVGALVLISLLVAAPVRTAAAEGWHSKWVAQSDYLTMQPGQTATFWIKFQNSGTETWTRGTWGRQVNLALNGDNKEPFRLGMACNWLWDDRIATTAQPTVAPGEVGLFNFCFRAPTTPGTYSLNLRPVVDGTAWLEDEGVFWVILVAPRRLVSLIEVGGSTDASPYSGGRSYGYAALVKNESATEAVTFVIVATTFYDASGTVLATDTSSVSYLAPQETSGVSGYIILSTPGVQVARVSAVVGTSSWAWRVSVGSGALAFSGPAFMTNSFSWRATATMRNPYTESFGLVGAFAVGRDAMGKIAGGGYTYAYTVPAASAQGVSVTYHGAQPSTLAFYATAARTSTR